MKKFLLIVIFFVYAINCFSQLKPDSNQVKFDTTNNEQVVRDTIVIDFNANNSAKGNNGSDSILNDSNRVNVVPAPAAYQYRLSELLKKNKLLNLTQKPVSLKSNKKNHHRKEFLFYLLNSIILVFGIFKVFYAGYFNNVFRVFFNTSLRQNQLTDLLLQAKLPSLIFNIFFTVMGGFYLWLLLDYYHFIDETNNKKALAFCTLTISLIYIFKFFVLKFIGWVTGTIELVDTYIFVIFLVNKITGIVLVPFIILLAFTASPWQYSVVILSYLIIGVLFLLRFIRSYSILQHQLNISRMHFILYVISIEVLPLLVCYKLFLGVLFKTL